MMGIRDTALEKWNPLGELKNDRTAIIFNHVSDLKTFNTQTIEFLKNETSDSSMMLSSAATSAMMSNNWKSIKMNNKMNLQYPDVSSCVIVIISSHPETRQNVQHLS